MDDRMHDDWIISKEREKREVERGVYVALNRRKDELLPHERFFLGEAIGYALRGLYNLARVSLTDAFQEPSEFSHYAMDEEAISRATPRNLERALMYLENSPVQEYPKFR
jgi:hypothetical protein